jgi:transcriptional regulator with XRE-family HTH domain
MGRSPNDVTDGVAHARREVPKAHHQELNQEVGGLRELRRIAGKAQADIASALNITQPSVSKIEKQTDMHLSTLRSYVEAIGGELELMVKLPERPAMQIHHLGGLASHRIVPERKRDSAPSKRWRHG